MMEYTGKVAVKRIGEKYPGCEGCVALIVSKGKYHLDESTGDIVVFMTDDETLWLSQDCENAYQAGVDADTGADEYKREKEV